MEININNRCPKPQFGMGYYLKGSKNINTNYHEYYLASKQMHYYANLKNSV